MVVQVLHDGGKVELVACTGKAPQPHTSARQEVMDRFCSQLAADFRFVPKTRHLHT
jgi:hypothetical protein